MNSEDQKWKDLIQSSNLETEHSLINSPNFAQKVVGEIKRASKSPPLATLILQNKYTYWVLFLGLVLFPAWAEANSLRLLCFS